MICKTDHLESVMLNLFRPAMIILCVPLTLLSIDLDDQPSLYAEKINGVVEERNLPPELEALEASSTKSLPQHVFRRRERLAEVSRKLAWLSSHETAFPHPCPSP